MDESAIDKTVIRFVAFAVAGLTAVSLYILAHDFIGLSRRLIVEYSLIAAGLVAMASVRSFLKGWT